MPGLMIILANDRRSAPRCLYDNARVVVLGRG